MIEEVYDAYRNCMYVENTHIIDIMLATYASTRIPGESLWLLPIASSGYGKTTVSRPFMALPDVLMLDTLSSKSLSTGRLGEQLKDKYTFILIPDLAGILNTFVDEKKAILAQFRTLSDGYIKRDIAKTSDGYSSTFIENIHTNMIAFSTQAVKKDMEFSTIIGTREIMYDLPSIINIDALYESGSKEIDKNSIRKTVISYVNGLNATPKELNDNEERYIRHASKLISIQRVNALTTESGTLLEPVHREIPMRLYRQLKKLWYGMQIVGVKDKEKIISEIVMGCGNSTRKNLIKILAPDFYGETAEKEEYTRKELSCMINIDQGEVLKQLMILRGLNCVDSEGDIFSVKTKWRANEDRMSWDTEYEI